MINENRVIEFIKPFYKGKDIMHDFSHVMRVKYTLDNLVKNYDGLYDYKITVLALYFHGFVYTHEDIIRNWLKENEFDDNAIEHIINASWEMQRDIVPETIEGKLVHDAHMIEGGKTYLIVKSLITGSVRGHNLETTIRYIEDNILGKGVCCLHEAQKIYTEKQQFAIKFIADLKKGLGLK